MSCRKISQIHEGTAELCSIMSISTPTFEGSSEILGVVSDFEMHPPFQSGTLILKEVR